MHVLYCACFQSFQNLNSRALVHGASSFLIEYSAGTNHFKTSLSSSLINFKPASWPNFNQSFHHANAKSQFLVDSKNLPLTKRRYVNSYHPFFLAAEQSIGLVSLIDICKSSRVFVSHFSVLELLFG